MLIFLVYNLDFSIKIVWANKYIVYKFSSGTI